jgi:hypothetical protein
MGKTPVTAARELIPQGLSTVGNERARRLIAKAEHTDKGRNRRFVVTNLGGDAQPLHDERYGCDSKWRSLCADPPSSLILSPNDGEETSRYPAEKPLHTTQTAGNPTQQGLPALQSGRRASL